MSAAAPDLSFSLSPNPSPFSVPSPVCAVSRGRSGLAEAVFDGGLHVGLFTGDLLFAQVLLDYIVHEMHPLVLPALDDVPNVGRLALADGARQRGVRQQDIVAGDPPLPVRCAEQNLGADTLERIGQHGSNLGLLRGRIHVDDPADRL